MSSFKKWCETIIHLPKVNQTHTYDCGAAALRAVASYFGVGPEREGDFIKACETSKTMGTDPTDIVKVAHELDLQAEAIENMSLKQLTKYLDEGKPVICAIQAYGEDKEDYDDLKVGHYVVVNGYFGRWIVFEDPFIRGNNQSRGRMSFEDFLAKWIDVDRRGKLLEHFGIVVWKEKAPQQIQVIWKTKEVK